MKISSQNLMTKPDEVIKTRSVNWGKQQTESPLFKTHHWTPSKNNGRKSAVHQWGLPTLNLPSPPTFTLQKDLLLEGADWIKVEQKKNPYSWTLETVRISMKDEWKRPMLQLALPCFLVPQHFQGSSCTFLSSTESQSFLQGALGSSMGV